MAFSAYNSDVEGIVALSIRAVPVRMNGAVSCFAVVDEQDYSAVSRHRWRVSAWGYAKTTIRKGGVSRAVYMHRMLLGLALGDKRQADHFNGSRMDNRRENLRILTSEQNKQNVSARVGSASGLRGVKRNRSKWEARACIGGKTHYLGAYETKEQAASVARKFRSENLPFSNESRHEGQM